ncbi:hypothetical protein IFM89_003414 [Coptis chinensis]|uniref:RBR-type E3 ubiquitin transferase n=1 Tax=Coptis chinensis TaxID=261450 RepID=A0A835GVY1_9MAGN|nr:hypothetical protein IFM89_003414 [Coptis chinensis]
MTSKKSKGKQKLINNNKSLPPMSPCPKGKRSVKVPKVIVEDVIDIEEDITRICAVLSISRVSAAILLCNYNWSVSNVHDAWFADEENVRKTVGLVEKPVVQYPKSKKVTCGICFDNYRHQEMSSAACGHLFCTTCWKGYISTSINDGPGCLILRCPDPSCDHGNRTGGYYSCNRYAAAKKDGEYEESEKRREMAKKSLERYTHYYERWATNHSSRLKAVGNLQEMQTVHIEKLIDEQCQLKSQLKFITDAWLQIIECRRVLKWTYAYGYYLPEQEDVKRNFFEYLQGQAESGLERLHKCAEKDLAVYLDQEGPSNDFNEFRTKLTGLTTVTRNYFENLVRALENGLADVDSHSACSKTGSSKGPGGGKKGKGGKSKGKTSKSNGDGQSQENHNQDNHSQENQGSWTCEHCTYLNDQPATICLMCNRHHGAWSCGFCTYFNTEVATSCQMCSQIR